MNESFLNSNFFAFYSALAIFESRIYVVVDRFGAKNTSLLSGCLVCTLFLKRLQTLISFRNRTETQQVISTTHSVSYDQYTQSRRPKTIFDYKFGHQNNPILDALHTLFRTDVTLWASKHQIWLKLTSNIFLFVSKDVVTLITMLGVF